MAGDNKAFNIVNSPRFIKWQNYAVPLIKIPTDKTILNNIENYYNEYNERVKRFLWSNNSTITLCVDGWNSKTTLHYFGITAHLLNNDEIKVLALGFKKCLFTDGKSIFENVKQVVEEYVIGHRIIAIVTDNGN